MAGRESVGKIKCLCCGNEIPVKQTTGGALSVSCQWCDLSAYAKSGTEAHRRITAALPKQQDQKPEEKPAFKPIFGG